MKIRRVTEAPEPALPCFELVPDSEAGSLAAFRVELEDRVISFARDDLRRWVLLHEEPQRLFIHIGHNLVVSVAGRGLEVLHDALDHDRLMTVRCSKQRGEQRPWVKSIELVDRPDSTPKA